MGVRGREIGGILWVADATLPTGFLHRRDHAGQFRGPCRGWQCRAAGRIAIGVRRQRGNLARSARRSGLAWVDCAKTGQHCGAAWLEKLLGLVWPDALVQRCAVHKHRNL